MKPQMLCSPILLWLVGGALVWGLDLGPVATVSGNAFKTIYCCPVSDSILSHSLLVVFVLLGPNIKSSRLKSCSVLT